MYYFVYDIMRELILFSLKMELPNCVNREDNSACVWMTRCIVSTGSLHSLVSMLLVVINIVMFCKYPLSLFAVRFPAMQQ